MPLATAVRQHFSLLLLPFVSLSAFLSGQALMDIAGSSLLAPVAVLAARRAAGPEPVHARGRSGADAILARNPFDSVTGALGLSADTPQAPLGAPPCEGVTVHAIVASIDPAWSFASFSLAGDDKTVLRRRGGILDRREHRQEVVRFIGARKSLDPVIARGIERVSATEFRIDRGVLEKILEDQAELLKGTAIGPDRENGRVVGVRILGVRPGSVLATLGLESGDRMVTLNGYEMSDPEKMLEAYALLRNAPRLMLGMVRNGKPMEIDYAIR